MKTFIRFLLLVLCATSAYAANTDANNLQLTQRNAAGSSWVIKYLAPGQQIDSWEDLQAALVAGGDILSVDAGNGLTGGGTSGAVTLNVVGGTGLTANANDVAVSDAELLALLGLTSAADRLPYFTGLGTASLATFTTYARSILDDADEATFKATVNLEPGVDVQAFDTTLSSFAALTFDATAASFNETAFTDGQMAYSASGNWTPFATSASGRTLLNASALTADGLGLTNGAVIDGWGGKTVPSGTVVGTSDSQTLSSKSLTAPTVTGVAIHTGTWRTTAAAMGALVVDITKMVNTKSVTGDVELTFSGTPAADTWFGVRLTETGAAARTITIPSSYDDGAQTSRTTFTLAASQQAWLQWYYDGSAYYVFGIPSSIADLTEIGTIATDDLFEVYDTSAGVSKYITEADLVTAVAAGSSGDVTAVGDVASGAAFNGTSGTTLTFDDPDGDQTFKLNTTSNGFEASAPLTVTGAISNGTSGVTTTGTIELGHASANTLSASAGDLSIEGNIAYRAGGTDVPVTDGGTGRSTGTTAYALVATGTTATGAQQTLANGATTEILIGGGASALPVWTTATGTGAPARAGSPVFTGNITVGSTAGSATLTAGQINLNTTNKQVGVHNGAKEVAIPLIQHETWSFDPKAVCDGAVDRLFLMSTDVSEPFGITVVKWKLSFEADPTTEVDLDLKRADAFIGVANSAVMDVLDTTAGASSEATAANINGGAVVATGKVLYLEFGTAYTETTHQIIFEMWYEIEED